MSFLPESKLSRKIPARMNCRRYLFLLMGIVILAVLLRCLHLFNTSYFVLSPDSYFFHWLAGRIIAGEGLPADAPAGALYTLHTGLTYPIVYLGKALSSVFSLSTAGGIDFASKIIPLAVGVVSLLVIYFAGSRIYNRQVGLFSALAWALMFLAVTIGGAGYIDRDGLSVLLVMAGALMFYFGQHLHLRLGKWDLGWLATSLAVFIIEGLLYLEWTWTGPLLLVAVITSYILVKFLSEYLHNIRLKPNTLLGLKSAFSKVNWRSFVLIIGASILLMLVYPGSDSWLRMIAKIVGLGGEMYIAEMRGIGLSDLLLYQLFLIPIILGIYLAWRKRDEGALFFTSWFLVVLILGLFAKRVMFYALPAVCFLSGVGLAFLWDWKRQGKSQDWRRGGISILLFLLLLLSFAFVYADFSNRVMAADDEWQDALTYLREETPQDASVMTSWGWGYWILDLGQRRPIVDNGFYGYNEARLRDVGLVYTTSDPVEAVETMNKYGADYLIFSQLDLDYQQSILRWVGLDEEYTELPDDSLFLRVLNQEFESEGGLEVVYRSVPNGEVIVLSLTQPE